MLFLIDYTPQMQEKFRRIYNKYLNLMFYIASGFFDNQQDKEDAVFEALYKIVSHLENLDEDEKRIKNFIAIVTKNTCISIKQKQDKIKQVSFENVAESEVTFENIEEDFDNKISLQNYKKALLKLPQNYYEVIYLKFFEELSNKEISKLLGISEQTCYKRLSRARKMLEKVVKENEDE